MCAHSGLVRVSHIGVVIKKMRINLWFDGTRVMFVLLKQYPKRQRSICGHDCACKFNDIGRRTQRWIRRN